MRSATDWTHFESNCGIVRARQGGGRRDWGAARGGGRATEQGPLGTTQGGMAKG